MRAFVLLVATAAALTMSLAVSAQLIVSEKEVRRQARVEWLSMKRHLPLAQDARLQAYVQCVADQVIATLPPEKAQADWEVVVFDDAQIKIGRAHV